MPALFFFGFRRIELRKEMQNPLEVYFEVCEEQGKAPDKPFSDRTYALPLEVSYPPDKLTVTHKFFSVVCRCWV